MPHRVTAFFRKNSAETPSELKGKGSRPPLAERAHTSIFPHLLDEDGNPKRMPDTHKRLSFQGLAHSARSSTKSLAHHPATLDAVIESPPLVFYGTAEYSTGALLSGQLVFHVNDESMPIESLNMKLCIETTRKRPFHNHCQECSHHTKELTVWNFLQAPLVLQKGMRALLFLHLPFH